MSGLVAAGGLVVLGIIAFDVALAYALARWHIDL